MNVRLDKAKIVEDKKKVGDRTITVERVVLSEKFYSKGYQKVLNHRIRQKLDAMRKDMELMFHHRDICFSKEEMIIAMRDGPWEIMNIRSKHDRDQEKWNRKHNRKKRNKC